jgi:virulence-associated protein VapD
MMKASVCLIKNGKRDDNVTCVVQKMAKKVATISEAVEEMRIWEVDSEKEGNF